jgi:hypothetical protein
MSDQYYYNANYSYPMVPNYDPNYAPPDPRQWSQWGQWNQSYAPMMPPYPPPVNFNVPPPPIGHYNYNYTPYPVQEKRESDYKETSRAITARSWNRTSNQKLTVRSTIAGLGRHGGRRGRALRGIRERTGSGGGVEVGAKVATAAPGAAPRRRSRGSLARCCQSGGAIIARRERRSPIGSRSWPESTKRRCWSRRRTSGRGPHRRICST